jgi:hypothetical protein
MRLFNCQVCGQLLYFENTLCMKCGATLGYLPEQNMLSALDPVEEGPDGTDPVRHEAPLTQSSPEQAREDNAAQADGTTPPLRQYDPWQTIWRAKAGAEGTYRFCANAQHEACNWLLPADGPHRLCTACHFNRTIPDITDPVNKERWQKIEAAKRRAFYGFIQLNLPLVDRIKDPKAGLAFDFLAEPKGGGQVMTGHEDGLITLAVVEADDAERVKRRTAMGEPYRTLLGHFRHESGHYFWDRLVRDGGLLNECRAVFGDDTQDYGEALKRHYATGAPADWQEHFVSAYATSHPWEDFAETWAHYLHIVDTLEMAHDFGLGIAPIADKTGDLAAEVNFDPYRSTDIQAMMGAWVPLTATVNSLNRCMGAADLYPFVLSPAVVDKLGFIQSLVHGTVPQLGRQQP